LIVAENEELYQYLVCDYYATGEGRTICLLITRAYPKPDDYEIPPDFVTDENGKMQYVPGILKYSQKFIAARQFGERFGSWYLQGADNLPREEFIEKWGRFLPEPVLNLLNSEDQPGNLSFSQEFHFNFS
jgi:hypothetical protein